MNSLKKPYLILHKACTKKKHIIFCNIRIVYNSPYLHHNTMWGGMHDKITAVFLDSPSYHHCWFYWLLEKSNPASTGTRTSTTSS